MIEVWKVPVKKKRKGERKKMSSHRKFEKLDVEGVEEEKEKDERDDSCPVCLDEEVKKIVVLKCTHKLCATCHDDWKKECFEKLTSFSCPLCRAVIEEPQDPTLPRKSRLFRSLLLSQRYRRPSNSTPSVDGATNETTTTRTTTTRTATTAATAPTTFRLHQLERFSDSFGEMIASESAAPPPPAPPPPPVNWRPMHQQVQMENRQALSSPFAIIADGFN
jgi:hypothetical protein